MRSQNGSNGVQPTGRRTQGQELSQQTQVRPTARQLEQRRDSQCPRHLWRHSCACPGLRHGCENPDPTPQAEPRQDTPRQGTLRTTEKHGQSGTHVIHPSRGRDREDPERPGTDARGSDPRSRNARELRRWSSAITQHSGLQHFCSLSARLLGHAASTKEEVDQTKSAGQQGKVY